MPGAVKVFGNSVDIAAGAVLPGLRFAKGPPASILAIDPDSSGPDSLSSSCL